MAEELVYGYRGKATIITNDKGVRILSSVEGSSTEAPGLFKEVDDNALNTWIQKDKLSDDLAEYQLETTNKAARWSASLSVVVSLVLIVASIVLIIAILK